MIHLSQALANDLDESLEWMTADMKHRADEVRGNLENGSKGGYSPELMKAIEAHDKLKGLIGD